MSVDDLDVVNVRGKKLDVMYIIVIISEYTKNLNTVKCKWSTCVATFQLVLFCETEKYVGIWIALI